MKIIFTVVFLIAGLSAFSQQRWIASFPQNLIGGGNGECICSDLDRNTIVGGTDIQKTPGGVLLKYDISGNLLWSDTDNITSFKKVHCLGNNIIATGSSHATTGQDRMFVAKWDSSGILLWMWQDTLSGINDQSFGFDLIINRDGNIFAVGQTDLHSGFVSNILAVGLDAAGNELWKKNYLGTDYYSLVYVSVNKLAADSSGNIYLSMDEYIHTTDFYSNVRLTKIDKTNGDELWIHRYVSGPLSYDVGRLLGVLDGGIIVENNTASSHAPYNYSIVFHYDLNGNILDSIIIPDQYPSSVVMDSHGNLISGGSISLNLQYPVQLRKHSYSGALIDSALVYGFSGNIGFMDMTIDEQDNIYLALEDEIICNSANFTAVKIDSDFNQLFIDSMDAGIGEEESPHKIFVNSSHDIMLTGFGNFICPSSDQTITTGVWSNEFITASINKIDYATGLNIYPNPSDGKINIDFSKTPTSSCHLTVFDLMGKLVFQNYISTITSSVCLNLSSGIYFLNFAAGNESVRRKIIVNQ